MSTTRRSVLRSGLFAGSAFIAGGLAPRAFSSPGGTWASLASFGTEAFATSAFNAALAAGVRNLYIPQGHWIFTSKPNPITYPLEISGEGFALSVLVRDFATPLETDAVLTVRSSNCRIAQIGIAAAPDTAGGAGIAMLASSPTSNPDFSVIEDVNITAIEPKGLEVGGTFLNAILIDGVARTSAPIGARDIDVRNCYLFASTNAACRINGGVSVSINGGGLFPAAGTTGRLQISGTSTVKSHYVTADVGHIGGLYVDNCNYANISAAVIAGDITNASSAQDVLVTGRCTGSVQSFWTRGKLIDPGV
jgi:hypothetical protein